MTKSVHDDVLDAAHDEVINNATTMIACSQAPTTRTEAVTTYALADIAIDSGDFAIADGDISGRKVTVAAQAGVTVDTSGIVTHVAIVDGTRLLRVTEEGTDVQSGTAQAGGASTITLAAGASATDDQYNGFAIKITSGTGVGQTRIISDYVGSTKVATVASAWSIQPDNTSVYQIFGTQVVGGATVDFPAWDIEIEDPA